ncbi:hypothetical protein D3C86_1166570 [compost metagenome]
MLTLPETARNLESKGYLRFGYSPVENLDYGNTLAKNTNVALNVALTGKITKWLSVGLGGNIGRTFNENETYWEPESYDARIMQNKATGLLNNVRTNGLPLGGKLDLGNGLGRSYNVRGSVNIDKNWNDVHRINATIGNEMRESFSKSSGETRYGYNKEINAFRLVNPLGTFRDINGNTQNIGETTRPVVEKTTRTMSYYAAGSYSFMDKYIVSGSVRVDDNNLLGVSRRKRAIPLWSAGLKWNLKKEAFIERISWLDQLSARFTYGFSGNAPQGYAPVTLINVLGLESLTGYPYANIGTPAMQDLAWEKTRMKNYGIDFSIFKGRFSGSVEYYQKLSTDILWELPINSTWGFSKTIFNTAKLNGHGVDIGLNVIPLITKDFTWSTNLNISYNTNVIKDERFDRPPRIFNQEQLYDGYPTDYVFSFIWAGLDKTGQSLIRNPEDQSQLFNTLDFPLGVVKAYSGRSNSPWFGSFGTSFNYKRFDLGFQFQFALGGVFRKPSLGNYQNYMVGRNGDLANRWKKPGDEQFTNVPAFLLNGETTNYSASAQRYTESDFLIRSRSNLSLSQVHLTYSLSPRLVSKIGLKGANVSAVCRNLGLIWTANKEGLDPNYLHVTGSNYQLSPVANYTFKLGINF